MRHRPGLPMLLALLVAALAFVALWPFPLERPRVTIELHSEVEENPAPNPLPFVEDGSMTACCYSPDAQALIAWDQIGSTAKCCDARTGRVRWAATCLGLPAFTPDSKTVALQSLPEGTVELRDVLDGRVSKTRVLPERLDGGVFFTSDARLVFKLEMSLRDVEGGGMLGAHDGGEIVLISAERPRLEFAFHQDEGANAEEDRWRLVNLATGRTTTFQTPGPINSLSATYDGRMVAALRLNGDGTTTCRFLNTETSASEALTLPFHCYVVLAPDGETAAVQYFDDAVVTPPGPVQEKMTALLSWLGLVEEGREWVSLRRVPDGVEIGRLPGAFAAFAPDAGTLVIRRSNRFELWDYPLRVAWLLRLSLAATVGVVAWGLLRWRRWAKASRAA